MTPAVSLISQTALQPALQAQDPVSVSTGVVAAAKILSEPEPTRELPEVRWPVAIAFTIASVSGYAMGRSYERLGLGFVGQGSDARNAFGLLVGSAVLATTAVALALWRRKRLGGTEALYWLGCALTLGFAMGQLFDAMGSSFFGSDSTPQKIGSGFLVGSLVVLATASALVRWRGNRLSRAEAAIYRFGGALASGWACSS